MFSSRSPRISRGQGVNRRGPPNRHRPLIDEGTSEVRSSKADDDLDVDEALPNELGTDPDGAENSEEVIDVGAQFYFKRIDLKPSSKIPPRYGMLFSLSS